MKYMLMICSEESALLSPEEIERDPEHRAWIEEMVGRGVLQGGAQLRGSGDATTVRTRDGEVLVSDGPFAETKEQIAGYAVVECADLDEAIEVASKHPLAKLGLVEVRPFWV